MQIPRGRGLSGQRPTGVASPPPWLWFGCLGFAILALATLVVALLFYVELLTPGQREAAKNRLPFLAPLLRNLDPPLPPPDTRLPTPLPGGANGANLLLTPPNFLDDIAATATETPPTPTPLSATPTTTAPTATPTTTTPQVATTPPTNIPASNATNSALPDRSELFQLNYQRQTWNNCGPANITMALSHFGWQKDQSVAATHLKPGGKEDKNVSPSEIVEFVERETDLSALARVGGDLELLRTLAIERFPVIIETGFRPEGYDWIGHYRTLAGYDHTVRQFFLYDSFIGPDQSNGIIKQSYTDLDEDWQHFNRLFIVIYEPAREERLLEILGTRASERGAAEWALDVAWAEARAQFNLGYAWFNIGASLTLLEKPAEATRYFDEARRVGIPWRMTWYRFTPYEAYFKAGRFADLQALLEATFNNGGEFVEETYYWRGRLLAAQGDAGGARYNFRTALIRNPNYEAARQALASLNA